MPPLRQTARIRLTAAAIPVGIAAAFAFQAPAASAAQGAAARGAATASVVAASFSRRPHSAARAAGYRRRHLSARLRAYRWARSQAGHPYVWGGIGPGYDCSGLVMMAYRHVGIHLPRTTAEMLASPLLVWVKHPQMGDLAFYGTGHVELFSRWGWTFGAHDYGSPVGLIHYGWGWKPTAYYRVR